MVPRPGGSTNATFARACVPVVIASAIAAIVVASLHLVASSVGADRML
jgi:hypothetical protein